MRLQLSSSFRPLGAKPSAAAITDGGFELCSSGRARSVAVRLGCSELSFAPRFILRLRHGIHALTFVSDEASDGSTNTTPSLA